jgi:hypothetical protein
MSLRRTSECLQPVRSSNARRRLHSRFGMALFRRLPIQPNFAITAIAASPASVAKMISASVLRAMRTDTGRFRFADTANKSSRCHFGFPVVFLTAPGRASGCPANSERQRCASLSSTSSNRSFSLARSRTYCCSFPMLLVSPAATDWMRSASAGF